VREEAARGLPSQGLLAPWGTPKIAAQSGTGYPLLIPWGKMAEKTNIGGW